MKTLKNESGKYDAYAWPGGYPIFYLCADNGVLCPNCANENAHLDTGMDDKQWHVVASDINWEDDALYCDNCNDQIESAYGEANEK